MRFARDVAGENVGGQRGRCGACRIVEPAEGHGQPRLGFPEQSRPARLRIRDDESAQTLDRLRLAAALAHRALEVDAPKQRSFAQVVVVDAAGEFVKLS